MNPVALCEECGSIQIVRKRAQPVDRLIELVTAKRPFACRRCGWTGRRRWTDDELTRLNDYGAAAGAAVDPSLVVLDEEQGHGHPQSRKRRRERRRSASTGGARPNEFDLSTLELPSTGSDEPFVEDHHSPDVDRTPPQIWRGRVGGRRKRLRRRRIAASLALSSLAIFLFAIVLLSRSCDGGSESLLGSPDASSRQPSFTPTHLTSDSGN